MPPPRPATKARSGSLEPGRPSRARSANTRHAAGQPHTPPADRMYATDVRRQTASSLNAPWAGGVINSIILACAKKNWRMYGQLSLPHAAKSRKIKKTKKELKQKNYWVYKTGFIYSSFRGSVVDASKQSTMARPWSPNSLTSDPTRCNPPKVADPMNRASESRFLLWDPVIIIIIAVVRVA